MYKAMLAFVCTAGLSLFSYVSLAIAGSPVILHANPVTRPLHYTSEVESDNKYQQRMDNLQQLAEYYQIDWSTPYLFIGEPKSKTIQTQQTGQGKLVVQTMLTPRMYSVIYRVNTPQVTDSRYVYIDKRHARAKMFDLAAKSVIKVSVLTENDSRILVNNIHDHSPATQGLLMRFARRLIDENICPSVVSGAMYPGNQATMFCGDGMQYSLSPDAIRQDKYIERRVVTQSASF